MTLTPECGCAAQREPAFAQMHIVKEYDIYLPLNRNDGSPVPPEKIARFKRGLIEHFGGLTHFPQENEGLWKFGKTTFRDKIVILRVLSDDEAYANQFFSKLRMELQEELEQAEVLIVQRDVRVVE